MWKFTGSRGAGAQPAPHPRPKAGRDLPDRELAILNNNYMLKKALEIDGLSMPGAAEGAYRLRQARLSWKKLTDETGVTTDDICRRIVDYGFQDYFASHHPRIILEPLHRSRWRLTKDDIDEFVAAFKAIAEEARINPEIVKTAPQCGAATQIQERVPDGVGEIRHHLARVSEIREEIEKDLKRQREFGINRLPLRYIDLTFALFRFNVPSV